MRKGFDVVVWLFGFIALAASMLLPDAASAQSCGPGEEVCDNGCMPYGSVCCYDGAHYCDPGETCSLSDNTCISGGSSGGSCNPGYVDCDGYCMPAGGVCCYFGTGRYCPSGTSCNLDNTCSSDGGGSSGGGTCPTGTVACGEYCMTAGRVCCANVGRDDLSCPSGTSCNFSGTCDGGVGGGSTGGSNGGSTGGSNGGSTGGSSGTEVCNDYRYLDGCNTIETCCSGSGCRYKTDGESFYCDGFDCYSAAQDLVSYCEDQASFFSCSASGSTDGAAWWALLFAGLTIIRNRGVRTARRG